MAAMPVAIVDLPEPPLGFSRTIRSMAPPKPADQCTLSGLGRIYYLKIRGTPVTYGTKPRIVIVGAGFGGLAVAQSFRHADADITLIDRQNHHLFQPLLYQVATAGLSPADIAWPSAT
jgi:NADPH-dependent 2,4-dienoyl-CoA reductase/sulfur reductase-like enzyme